MIILFCFMQAANRTESVPLPHHSSRQAVMAPNNTANGVEAPRFEGVVRPYSQEDVKKLQGSLKIEHTLAAEGSKKLWVRLFAFFPSVRL
jgi:isocitrate lyase